MKPMKFNVEAGWSHTNMGPPEDRTEFRVRVVDPTSGQHIVELRFNRSNFLDFMSNSGQVVAEGELTENFHRIGKVHKHTSVQVKGEDGLFLHGEVAEKKGEEICQTLLAEGWEVASVGRRNYGLEVIARKWVEEDTSDTDS